MAAPRWSKFSNVEPETAEHVPAIPANKSHPSLGGCSWFPRRGAFVTVLVGTVSASLVVMALAQFTKHGGRHPAVSNSIGLTGFASNLLLWADDSTISGWDLLKSPDVHESATLTLLRVGKEHLGANQEALVRGTVIHTFHNLSQHLKSNSPEAIEKLKWVPVTRAQQDSVSSLLRLLSDDRIHILGLEVARAIHGTAPNTGDVLRQHIEQALKPRAAEIAALKKKAMPQPLRQVGAQEARRPWGLTLVADNVHAMRGVDDDLASSNQTSPRNAGMQRRALGLERGSLEAMRAVLHFIEIVAQSAGVDLELPLWARSPFGKESIPCGLVSVRGNTADPLRGLFCPLRFGVQGVDALWAADDAATLSSDL